MKRNRFSRIGPIALVAGMLGSLAAGAPSFNAGNTAPRSVFLTLPEEVVQPQITLTATQDQSGGWILRIDATGFQFTEICMTEAEAAPIGHAHIIKDGTKLASSYGPIFDLGVLPAGAHRISVVLRGQDHRALIGTDGLIAQEIVIDVAMGSSDVGTGGA